MKNNNTRHYPMGFNPATWNKCDVCGRFISMRDLETGNAIRRLITPDSEYTKETYETLCAEHKHG